MKRLNPSEIDRIRNYVKSCGVEYIDVQHELVDHLASSIESKLEKKPDYLFETAMDDIHTDYFFEINTIKKKRKGQIVRYWNRKIISLVRKQIDMKLILFFLLAFAGLFTGTLYISIHTIFIFYIFCTLFSLYVLYHLSIQDQEARQKKKKYLFYKVYQDKLTDYFIPIVTFFPCYCLMWMSSLSFRKMVLENDWLSALLSILVILMFFFSYLIHYKLPDHLKMEIEQNHPYALN